MIWDTILGLKHYPEVTKIIEFIKSKLKK
jgi:hypothetical protein